MNEVKLLNIGGIDQNVKDQYARDIIAPSENGLDSTSNLPVASRHYNAGEFLIGQDRLYYEALVEINVGDTLVVNSNIKATTVSDELVSLRNKSADSALETIAYVENGVTSTRAYSIGSYLYWNYGLSAGLYKAKVAISPSDALVVDTNIEAVPNIGSQIHILANQVDDISDEIADMNNVLGAKNLLPNNATSQTINGVTFTVNSDGSVTASGKATATAILYLLGSSSAYVNVEYTNCTISGCPSGGGNSYRIIVQQSLDGSTATVTEADDGNGKYIGSTKYPYSRVYIRINSGQTCNNLVFKPMIRPASIADDTYVPYAMTNRELTESAINNSNNDFGTPIDITEYNASLSSRRYVFPSDGYVTLRAAANSNTIITVDISGANSSTSNAIRISASFLHANTHNAVFVKKGMKAIVVANQAGGTASFIPLI